MKAPSCTVVFLTSCIFAISPAIALGQHGGGPASSGHAASASTHSSISSHGSNGTSASHNSSEAGKRPSIVVVSGKSDRGAGVRNDRWELGSGSSSTTAANDRWLNGDAEEGAHPREVTIGLPEVGTGHSAISEGPDSFAGEAGGMSEGQVQRGTRPAVPMTRPMSGPAATATAPPQLPASRPLSRPPQRPTFHIRSLQIQPLRALWFLAPPNQSHVFRRRFFGGFGFFGFGLPFSFGFGPDCNPFWAEPFAFGCNTFGYFSGYGGYGFAPQQEENFVEPPELQEPEENVFVPEEQSSPEEIQAEKVLFVLFMKNGALYAVTNYWIQDGKLHYLTSYGGENTIDMSDLDLQKTVDVNAKRGLNFTLTPRTDGNRTNEPQPQEP